MTLRIKELRLKKGWSQKQLAELAGIAKSTLGEIETHKMLPRQDALIKIAEALGVSVDELYL